MQRSRPGVPKLPSIHAARSALSWVVQPNLEIIQFGDYVRKLSATYYKAQLGR